VKLPSAASYDSARQPSIGTTARHASLCWEIRLGRTDMKFYYVYILQSSVSLNRFYTGFTENVKERLAEDNAGKSVHTRSLRP